MPVHTRKRARACRREEENLDKSGPDSPLVNFISDYAGGEVFLANVIPRLNVSDLKFAYGTCKTFRETIRKSGFDAQKSVYRLHEFSSESTLRYALERGLVTRYESHRAVRGRRKFARVLGPDYVYRWVYTPWWTFNTVLESGRLDLVRFLVEEMNYVAKHRIDSRCLVSKAVQLGYLDILKYLVSKGFTVSARSISLAAEEGHWECLMYLRTKNAPWMTPGPCEYPDTIKYTPLYYAVNAGNLPMVIYLLQNNCPKENLYLHYFQREVEYSICTTSVKNGDLKCLHILRAYDVPWYADTSYAAAEGGNLEILKYCVENGCPIDEDVYFHATRGGHLECLKYLNETARVPWSFQRASFWLQRLTSSGCEHVDCLNYVRDHWSLH